MSRWRPRTGDRHDHITFDRRAHLAVARGGGRRPAPRPRARRDIRDDSWAGSSPGVRLEAIHDVPPHPSHWSRSAPPRSSSSPASPTSEPARPPMWAARHRPLHRLRRLHRPQARARVQARSTSRPGRRYTSSHYGFTIGYPADGQRRQLPVTGRSRRTLSSIPPRGEMFTSSVPAMAGSASARGLSLWSLPRYSWRRPTSNCGSRRTARRPTTRLARGSMTGPCHSVSSDGIAIQACSCPSATTSWRSSRTAPLARG